MDLEVLQENIESRDFLQDPLTPFNPSTSSALRKDSLGGDNKDEVSEVTEDSSIPSTPLVETLFPPSFLQEETGSVVEGTKNPHQLVHTKFPPACLPQLRAFLLLAEVVEEKSFSALAHSQATLSLLSRELRVLDVEEDPIIAFAPQLHAWLWLLEDSLTLTLKEDRRGQSEIRLLLSRTFDLDALLSDSLQAVSKGVKEVGKRIEGVEKALGRVKKSWKNLSSHSASKFDRIAPEAEEHFGKVVKPVIEGKVKSFLELKKKDQQLGSAEGKKKKAEAGMRIRWDLNGLMFQQLQQGNEGFADTDRWVKLVSLPPKGRRILVENLVQGIREFLQQVTKELSQLELELEREIRPKLKGLRALLKKEVTATFFFPREEKEVHCLTLSCCHLVAQVEPQLERIKVAFALISSALSDLKDREWRIRKGKGRRVPLDRWGKIDLRVETVVRGQELGEIVAGVWSRNPAPNRPQEEENL